MDFDRSLRSLQEAVIHSLLRRRGVAVFPREVDLALQNKRPRDAFAALVALPPKQIVASIPQAVVAPTIDAAVNGQSTQSEQELATAIPTDTPIDKGIHSAIVALQPDESQDALGSLGTEPPAPEPIWRKVWDGVVSFLRKIGK